jgi:hypothetical protein
MNIKKMLLDIAEQQADAIQKQAIDHLASAEMEDMIATEINKKIDIPFVNEKQEQKFFKSVVGVCVDVIENAFKGK